MICLKIIIFTFVCGIFYTSIYWLLKDVCKLDWISVWFIVNVISCFQVGGVYLYGKYFGDKRDT